MALELGGLSAPGTTLGFGQRLVFAPGLGGSAQSGTRGPLGGRVRVFGNDQAAPAQVFKGPVIDKSTGAATHGLGLLKEPGMRFEQLRVEGGEGTGGGGPYGFAQAFLQPGHQSATLRRGIHALNSSTRMPK